MSEETVTIQIRILGLDPLRGVYPVEASLDDGRFFQGEMKLDREKLLTLQFSPQEYGRHLYNALFAGDIRDAYMMATSRADERSLGQLRVRLWIANAAAELHHEIAWERIVDESASRPVPLTTSADTPFSRYIGLNIPDPTLVSERPLRLLVVVSNPEGLPAGMSEVQVKEEVLSLLSALGELSRAGQVAVTVMPGRTGLGPDVQREVEEARFEVRRGESTLNNILRHLQDQHVLHFIGHGQFQRGKGQGGGRGALYLEDTEGGWKPQDDETLVTRLGNLRPQPLLIFLAACESARGDSQGAFVGLGPKLVQAGIPAVVAMREKVDMDVARDLTADFYQRLLKHGEVDRALNEARNLLLSLHTVDWAIPVLYMRLRDGRLLAKEVETTPQKPAATTPAQVDPDPPVAPKIQRDYSAGPLDGANRTRIRKALIANFNLSELQDICLGLDIDHENFVPTKGGLARELLLYCERRGMVPALIEACREERPGVDW